LKVTKYIDHIWGEHEVGGTSVIYISDIDLVKAGWPANLDEHAVPDLAVQVLSTVPTTFLTVGAAMAGIHWVIRRRQKFALQPEDAAPQTEPSDSGEQS